MRTAPAIQALWDVGGPFIGNDARIHGRVTVQGPWAELAGTSKTNDFLRVEDVYVGNYAARGIPLRWFQKEDNSQDEAEVPNVKNIKIDRSIEQDAGTCEIQIYNQRMDDDGMSTVGQTELGKPGYYTFNRGISLDAQARWGQVENEWKNVLVPNAVLRTYQGYGGNDLTIFEAEAEGYLLLTGVWLVDDVNIHTDGMLTVKCRDMMKLLIEQQLYPPLVPKSQYPLSYYRYQIFSTPVTATPLDYDVTNTATTQAEVAPGDKRAVFYDSGVDHWYPQGSAGSELPNGGFLMHGHRGVDCLDGNPDTFCLSVGNSGPDKPFAYDWWEFDCGEQMNAVYIHPWAGNYTCFVSVLENGLWQGGDVIPYDPGSLVGTQPYSVDTGGAIPYVASFGVPWEEAGEYILPRVYAAQRVRVTFHNEAYSDWGPWHYRCGMREFRVRASGAAAQTQTTTTTQHIHVEPFFTAGDGHPVSGYITCDWWYQIDAFGDARVQPLTSGAVSSNFAYAMRFTPSGDGYYLISFDGRLITYGDAVNHGDPFTDGFTASVGSPGVYGSNRNIIDMAVMPGNDGYWVLSTDGSIYAYGTATAYADVAPTGTSIATSIDCNVAGNGIWVLDGNGHVFTYGAATGFGNFTDVALNHVVDTTTEKAQRLRRNLAGDGYWIMTDYGHIQAFGAAGDFGDVPDPSAPTPDTFADFHTLYWQLLTVGGDDGYIAMRGNGDLIPMGNADYYGAPIPGSAAEQRKDGNYLDYTDIIKDLALWSGFLLQDPNLPQTSVPAVFGNLESTGSFSPEMLPPEIFDKHPVVDAMHQLKETVGYLLWVDEIGALHFESPNWWSIGNFDEDGTRLTDLPEVDEKVTLTDYSVVFADDSLRSLVIISSEDPDESLDSTITTRLIPRSARLLRGLCKPAMWVNGWFQKPDEQRVMVELIALHIHFETRIGNITAVANPCIQINDQVRVLERQTAETFIHYVRGMSTEMDLDAGTYTMTLSTNWLGDADNWSIQDQGTFVADDYSDPDNAFIFTISDAVVAYLKRIPNKSASHFNERRIGLLTSTDTTGTPSGTDNAGPT